MLKKISFIILLLNLLNHCDYKPVYSNQNKVDYKIIITSFTGDKEINKYTNKYIKKIHDNLENFSYNKIVANLYEMYSFLNKQIEKPYTKLTIFENYQKILITMTPVVPHFANECLSTIQAKNFKWPEYNKSMLKEEIVNIVIQINGRKRGLIQSKPDITEEKLFEIIKNDEKIMKYLDQKNIKKKIYIKDKLLNIII